MPDQSAPPADLEGSIGAVFDDPDFVSIHRQISPLNLFEAVGATRAELRHSNFLAYLLSPSRPHGLGVKPLAAVLRSMLGRLPPSERPIMTLELIAGDLDDAIVYRERSNIDILIELPSLRLVVAIENKVGAKAGAGQLERYRTYLESDFSGYRRLLVFLTPDGTDPDHPDYLAYDYAELANTLESVTDSPIEQPSTETLLIVRHYVEMVRRYVVQDERLRALAITLYERHKEAFDFIFECRPDPLDLLSVVRQAVQNLQDLAVDSGGGNLFRFVPERWDQQLTTIKGDPNKWSKTGRGLLFECKTYPGTPGRVNVSLILGPGDLAMRKLVYEKALAQSQLFSGLVKPMGQQWVTIFSRDLLTSAQARGLSFEQQANNVSLAWSDFQGTQLRRLVDAVIAIDEEISGPPI